MQPSVCVALSVLFVAHLVTFSGLLCQGQQASRPHCRDAVNDTCCTCDTTGSINVTLCSGPCPSGYYQDNGIIDNALPDPECLPAPTTTPAHETTNTAPTTTLNSTDSTVAPTTTTTVKSDVNPRNICSPCHPYCENCNGSGPTNCIRCKDEFEKNNTTHECQKKGTADDNNQIAIIAGASAAGGVVLVVVVVVVVVCCVRRRRRHQGMKDMGNSSVSGIGLDQTPVPEIHREENECVESVRRGEIDLTYENIPKAPRPLSIQRGHDQVTRYVRDPTIKRTDATEIEAVLPHSPTEAKELEALPVAPTLPRGQNKKSLQPPAEQYEVVEAGQDNQGVHFQQNVHPQRAVTSKPKGRQHHGGGRGGRRKTGPGDLPNPAVPFGFSTPNLPSQVNRKVEQLKAAAEAPEEDYINMEEPVVLKVKTGGDESEEEDYENAPAKSEKRDFCAPPADDDDLEDYENTGAKGSLLPHTRVDKHQLHGEINAGAVLDDEPQEVYGNQEAIEDADRHHHGRPQGSEDDDQPLYTNDDTENPYQNIHFGPKT